MVSLSKKAVAVMDLHGVEYHHQIVHPGFESLDAWALSGAGSITLTSVGMLLSTGTVLNRFCEAYFGDSTMMRVNFDLAPIGIWLINLPTYYTNGTYYWVLGYPTDKHAGFKVSGGALYASVHNGTVETNELITGITLNAYHKYEVTCSPAAFEFWIDNVLAATITTGLPTGQSTLEVAPLTTLYVQTLNTVNKRIRCANFWTSREWF